MATAAHKIISVNVTQANLPSKGSSSRRTSLSAVGTGVIPPMYSIKVTRGFLDAVYKLFDGLMLLASDESPALLSTDNPVETKPRGEVGVSELFDLRDGVNYLQPFLFALTDIYIIIGRQVVIGDDQSGTP